MSLRLDHKYRPLTIARSLLGKWSCWSPGDSNRQTGPWPFAGRFSVDLKILPRPFSHFPPSRRKTARPTAFPNSTASQHATPTSAHSRVEITADKVKTSAVRFPHHLHGKVSGHDFQSCRKVAPKAPPCCRRPFLGSPVALQRGGARPPKNRQAPRPSQNGTPLITSHLSNHFPPHTWRINSPNLVS